MGFERKFIKGLLVLALVAVISHIGSSNVVRLDDGEGDPSDGPYPSDPDRLTKRSADEGEGDPSDGPDSGDRKKLTKRSTTAEVFATVNLTHSVNVIDSRFVSIAVGARSFLQISRNGFNVNSTRLLNLAKALAPAYVRCGGSYANFLIYKPDDEVDPIPHITIEEWEDTYGSDFHSGPVGRKGWVNFNVTETRWVQMLQFFRRAGWLFLFNFNQLLTKDGRWSSENAELMLRVSMEKDLRISGFQLSNEPNSGRYKYGLDESQWDWNTTLDVYRRFQEFLNENPDIKATYGTRVIAGPDATSLARHYGAFTFLQKFFGSRETNNLVSRMGLHQYYLDGKNSVLADYLNPTTFEQLKLLWERADFVRRNCSRKGMKVWLTETASAYGGGKPGVTDSFADIFIWLDELAYGAQLGFNQINRQNFRSAHYSLIDWSDTPNPDFYISVLHKRLVRGNVYTVDVSPANNRTRFYAGCTRQDFYNYAPGSITLIAMNILEDDSPFYVVLPQWRNLNKYVYMLTRNTTQSYEEGMSSKEIFLNGKPLTMTPEMTDIPELTAATYTSRILLPGHSVAFIVLEDANVEGCK